MLYILRLKRIAVHSIGPTNCSELCMYLRFPYLCRFVWPAVDISETDISETALEEQA